MDGEESKTRMDSEQEVESGAASAMEDSAVSSMTSEDGEISDPDPDELDIKIRDLMSRLDLNGNKNGVCEDDDEGFSSLSRSTLNMFGSQMVVGDNDVFTESTLPKQKYTMHNGFDPAIKRTKPEKDEQQTNEKVKRRLSENPTGERRLSRLGSFMKKLSRSRSEPSGITDLPTSGGPKRKTSVPDKRFTPGSVMRISVESLPQLFHAKYLGSRLCSGVWGPEHTRPPVDSMIRRARSMSEGEDLPMVKVIISQKGIDVRSCAAKRSTAFSNCLMPIEFISYGVQDVKYTRVFTCIVVKEMSWKGKKMECHAYLCDSSLSARKMALSVALAFKAYTKVVEGKSSFHFKLDLDKQAKVPDETTPVSECEA